MTGNDVFDPILKEVQFWSAIYELDRYAGKISNMQYDTLIDKLVDWAQACVDQDKGVKVDVPAPSRNYHEVLAATVAL